ncbi:hypothetical protein GC105_08080 [Alkalibaculum sp. M08DMB]|uniref:Sodium:proton antiporter n=1 Tax=Alkalibaculum sporogenes TaxID=2655001 RepID=A0A6A7K8M3_9FIRM|nr:Na+/H+ antiporter subunit E [Alkalibaculum sporogenes]MPW25746.1 hypothetical protein [Alkalibaculum sporogenes]
MKKVINYTTMIVIFTILWVILNESATLFQILIGIIVSIIAIYFTNSYLLLDDYIAYYYVKTFVLIKYLIYLIFQIYKSGISSIGQIIRGDSKVIIIEYESCLNDELSICLLANAITLTPGTVTIDKKGNALKILCFEGNNEIKDAFDVEVCSKFEQILKGRK